ncbi:MAG: type II toxin-antitoxin system VapC family toxin [Acetobacteraceae bacterium]|nr:type II toxin-antitoxin system VapC family toxin [Acetobacteraceae bacterium]
MTPVLVDSNVLLDVLGEDATWMPWSAAAVADLGASAPLVINPVIFAEVSVRSDTIEAMEEAFPEALFRREPIPWPAAFLAGKAFLAYRRRGGARRSPLPDFLIGAHAAVAGYRLLTRDATRYRTYFPKLELIAPP